MNERVAAQQRRLWRRYRAGAFQLQCNWPEVDLDSFPRDHLRDIFSAVRSQSHSHPLQVRPWSLFGSM